MVKTSFYKHSRIQILLRLSIKIEWIVATETFLKVIELVDNF